MGSKSSSGGMLDNDVLGTGALLGPVGYGFAGQSKYAEKAATERAKGLAAAAEEEKKGRAGFAKYEEYGVESLNRQNKLFTDPSYLQETGGYKFAMEQGLKGTTAARSNKSIFSGETLKALTEYSAGLASQEYGKEWDRLQKGIEQGFQAQKGIAGSYTTSAEIEAGKGEAEARKYDQRAAALAGEVGFGRQIFGQWSGAFAQASASSSGACWVAEELYGVDDIKTHTIRAYVEKHTNDATGLGDWCRAYIEHGVEWAARIKENMSARMDALPVWEYLYAEALKEGT